MNERTFNEGESEHYMRGGRMITLHGEEVRLGDEVWDVLYGWGEVTGLKDSMKNVYPIGVQFEGASRWYTEDGKLHAHKENPTLFWQPIEFEIPKKPKKEKVMSEWQPIETAPKDGSRLLLATPTGKLADGMWSTQYKVWDWPYVITEPTHWMPAPPIPQKAPNAKQTV